MNLNLGADELLTTTRAVRRRLDFDRPVEREVIEQCIRMAQQAPSASNSQAAHFVVVADPAKKAALAELWRKGRSAYAALPIAWQNYRYEDPAHAAALPAMGRSVNHLADNLERAPVMVVPCITFRTEGTDVMFQALVWGAVLPSVWSFCLAARERGLGTCWTAIHLAYEKEGAEILEFLMARSCRSPCCRWPTREGRTSSPPGGCRSSASSTGTAGRSFQFR